MIKNLLHKWLCTTKYWLVRKPTRFGTDALEQNIRLYIKRENQQKRKTLFRDTTNL